MAYTNFTLYDLRTNFGIRDRVQPLFKDVTPLPMSSWLRDTLAMTRQMPLTSEKAKSERGRKLSGASELLPSLLIIIFMRIKG
jgi:hypothetical protein